MGRALAPRGRPCGWRLLRLLARSGAISRRRGLALLTRYPPGLVSALRKLAQGAATPDPPALRHLWIMAPGDATHPPVDERIAALQEL